jgi:IS605 OrfB family transposase
MKNISQDYAHKVGGLVAELALKYRSAVVLEDLEKIRENGKKGRRFNKKLGLWFYRRVVLRRVRGWGPRGHQGGPWRGVLNMP